MRNLLSSARVPDMLVEYILGLGFEDIADFAYAYADASDLSKLLDGVPPETWTSMGVTDPEHSIPAARIRRAFVMAKASASQESLALAEPVQLLLLGFPPGRARLLDLLALGALRFLHRRLLWVVTPVLAIPDIARRARCCGGVVIRCRRRSGVAADLDCGVRAPYILRRRWGWPG
ncbi:unnamed protein product [Effrenium voratum]|nr:unnamed protein product [Effrenium voratum]